ncbi:Metallocarboxypeptidase A [Podospora aff. communis PSN243]|uniref:Metallocarboxypeptidase A n=1 Tax=Podospora aff. communis PSN243 TaxID=3040156 RepID=A0AAV9G5Q0_9PEZI|nr:Metallocarboxypeptidase A [Podospora aff. communis PSN243]
MKFTNSVSALLGFLALASGASVQTRDLDYVSYDGYKVFRLSFGDNVAKVSSIIERLGLTTWKGAPVAGRPSDIVVPPTQVANFLAEVRGMTYITMHEDLGKSIEDEAPISAYQAGRAPDISWFNSYHSYAEHLQWLNDLQAAYPTRSQVVSTGTSLNGRNITGIHFWGSSGKGKPAVVFHGTVHAREWISTMVVEYFAFHMLSNSGNAEMANFLNKYDFIFFPIANPDGFVFTQTNNRLWRKNRQTTSGSTCIGHDINRNWAYKWDVSGGASTNPCAEDYKGRAALDAPETAALAAFLRNTKASQGVKLYMDWHAYSQMFMTPYGYSCTDVPAKNTELLSLASGAAAAIRAVFGTTFTTGSICKTIYKATGSSVDYVNEVVKADYVFTAELRDKGANGFVLPANQIIPSGQEAYAGVRYLLLNMK